MRLFSRTFGEGFPLIILHGFLGSSDNWTPQAKRFGEFFKVFALDLCNHGQSPHSAEINYQVMAEDVREFMDTHALTEANLLGHSMGGKVAMQLAAVHPEAIRKLVVVDIAPKAYRPEHREILDAMLALDLGRFANRTEIDRALAAAIPEAAVRQFLLKNITRDEAGRFKWKINLNAINRNYERLTEAITLSRPFDKPTLFVKGEWSNYIRPADEALIRQNFPNARVVTVPRAGHWVHADAPEQFFDLVSKFLAANENE